MVKGRLVIELEFKEEDICRFIGNDKLSAKTLSKIADTLVANLDDPLLYSGIVEIYPANFNDSFEDMKEDLRETYGKKLTKK